MYHLENMKSIEIQKREVHTVFMCQFSKKLVDVSKFILTLEQEKEILKVLGHFKVAEGVKVCHVL